MLMAVALLTMTACKGVSRGGTNGSHMQMNERVHDFGEIPNGQVFADCDFAFTNDGDDPLVITKVDAYCHCTAVNYPEEPIKPGKSGTISVRLNASDVTPGFFKRKIVIYLNNNQEPVVISVQGQKKGEGE